MSREQYQLPTNGSVGDTTTGWGLYSDTQYTSASPLSVSADTDTILPNNKGEVIETQLPADVTTFYDGTKFLGRSGDGLLITVNMVATPTSNSTTTMDIWFDIGGGTDPIFPQLATFPRGNGVEREISFTVAGYTLDTWEANGAVAYIRANGPVEVHDVQYILTRTHKARDT